MNQNTKWTPQEDQKLYNSVKKYGTQWNLVSKDMGHSRSQNALIKRWHSHLKQRQNSNTKMEENQSSCKKSLEDNNSLKNQSELNNIRQENVDQVNQEEDQGKVQRVNHEIIQSIQSNEYDWKYRWCEQEECRLKKYIVYDSIFNWDKLGEHFGNGADEVKARWIKVVYPKIKNSLKIGGAVKWSSSEDSILYGADKAKIAYTDLMFFLPGRTVYSIEARWRRMLKNSDVIDHMAVLNERNSKRKQMLAKINRKMKLQKQSVMDKICEAERANFQKQKLQLNKFQMMKRSEKARKQYKLMTM